MFMGCIHMFFFSLLFNVKTIFFFAIAKADIFSIEGCVDAEQS